MLVDCSRRGACDSMIGSDRFFKFGAGGRVVECRSVMFDGATKFNADDSQKLLTKGARFVDGVIVLPEAKKNLEGRLLERWQASAKDDLTRLDISRELFRSMGITETDLLLAVIAKELDGDSSVWERLQAAREIVRKKLG